jgi:hypothetical protein
MYTANATCNLRETRIMAIGIVYLIVAGFGIYTIAGA